MKVLKLNTTENKLTVTEKLIKAILSRNIDAFQSTSRQFLRNNQDFVPQFTGFSA